MPLRPKTKRWRDCDECDQLDYVTDVGRYRELCGDCYNTWLDRMEAFVKNPSKIKELRDVEI